MEASCMERVRVRTVRVVHVACTRDPDVLNFFIVIVIVIFSKHTHTPHKYVSGVRRLARARRHGVQH
eukprot:COSAG02_NODE_2570_length_8510_cov_6.332541_10_plen_67_part_00